MAKLYYGGGNCSIEGRDIVGVEINYRGSIFIDDKTPSNYAIMQKNNKIIIFPYGRGKDLSNLFDYNGEFRITSLIASDKNAQKVSTSIHKVLDYSEFLDSNSEDMTVKSEDLNQGFVSNNRVRSAGIKQTHIKSLHTDDWNMWHII